MKISGKIVAWAALSMLPVIAAGCTPTRSYEWASDKGPEVQACYDACADTKYKCYPACGFGLKCEMGCDREFDACLSRCPGLTIRQK